MDKITKVPSLNGIRGFAVLLVLLSHASNAGISIHPYLSFGGAGRYGVFLFFVLSAFLLTTQFLQRNSLSIEFKLFVKHYIVRRFLRIYPLFISALCVYYLLAQLDYSVIPLTQMDVLRHLFLLDGKNIFWSIPVEFQYYFVLPLVSLLLVKTERMWVGVAAIVCFTSFWWLWYPPQYVSHLLPFLPIFILGSGAAFCSIKISNRSSGAYTAPTWPFNALAILGIVLFLVFNPTFFNLIFSSNVGYSDFHKQFLLFAMLSCCLIVGVIQGDGIIKRLMEQRFFVFWGKVSFSAYLYHLIALKIVGGLEIPVQGKFILFIVITAACSWLSYKYFELPLSKANTFKEVYSKTIKKFFKTN